ncbi:hypothetical protein [Formosa sp. PL04]|nr:hypothetical protein [Formosa sp. PL04]MDW5290840.1 hypothetical protein [Formosa sp. PL04]
MWSIDNNVNGGISITLLFCTGSGGGGIGGNGGRWTAMRFFS